MEGFLYERSIGFLSISPPFYWLTIAFYYYFIDCLIILLINYSLFIVSNLLINYRLLYPFYRLSIDLTLCFIDWILKFISYPQVFCLLLIAYQLFYPFYRFSIDLYLCFIDWILNLWIDYRLSPKFVYVIQLIDRLSIDLPFPSIDLASISLSLCFID